ncbi:MAG: NAD(P)-dependent oxidoreductase [Desulfobacteraceae bacterium]|nr:NAD(P)-dependent oxidoreductase [Desulfobacteraceae bacterium]
MKRDKILITGAGGFLGWALCRQAMPMYTVFGTYLSNPVGIKGVHSIQCDLTRYPEVKTLISEVRPQIVVHAAAVGDPNYCQLHPAETSRINVQSALDLATLCADGHVCFGFTSTDLIFDGQQPPYTEEDAVNPVSVYGEQKAEAEIKILIANPDALVCRMPLMVGFSGSMKIGFARQMVMSILNGDPLNLFIDEYRTPVDIDCAAKGILKFTPGLSGVIHLGGRITVSRYDIGRIIASHAGVEGANINAVHQRDVPMPAPRPRDVSLDSSRAFEMGYDPMGIRSVLKRIIKVFQTS